MSLITDSGLGTVCFQLPGAAPLSTSIRRGPERNKAGSRTVDPYWYNAEPVHVKTISPLPISLFNPSVSMNQSSQLKSHPGPSLAGSLAVCSCPPCAATARGAVLGGQRSESGLWQILTCCSSRVPGYCKCRFALIRPVVPYPSPSIGATPSPVLVTVWLRFPAVPV